MDHEHVLLVGHGTVEDLDDLPQFLSNIRHGRPTPPELAKEMRRRYEAIGGSPLLSISRELAEKLERELKRPVHLAMRFWHPFTKDVLEHAARAGAKVLDVVSLAPFSAHLYAAEVRRLLSDADKGGTAPPELRCAPDWGSEPLLVDAFATAIVDSLAALDPARRADAEIFFTAHSLPLSVVEQGDRYPDEVQKTAQAVAARARLNNHWRVVYQSQGAGADRWLGPGIRESLLEAKSHGARDIVLSPIGFLGDHVEILYDLDIEALAWAGASALRVQRTRSLNASDGLVHALAAVVRRLAAPT
jgi:protoporphyrin/coproporphyrin ferrochelatase